MRAKIAAGLLVLLPGVALGSTGPLVEVLFLFGLVLGNILWAAILPLYFLSRCKKKVSFLLMSLTIDAALAALVIFGVPHLVSPWLDLDEQFSMEGFRIALAIQVVASIVAFLAARSLLPKIMLFNDLHD